MDSCDGTLRYGETPQEENIKISDYNKIVAIVGSERLVNRYVKPNSEFVCEYKTAYPRTYPKVKDLQELDARRYAEWCHDNSLPTSLPPQK